MQHYSITEPVIYGGARGSCPESAQDLAFHKMLDPVSDPVPLSGNEKTKTKHFIFVKCRSNYNYGFRTEECYDLSGPLNHKKISGFPIFTDWDPNWILQTKNFLDPEFSSKK